jgi:hypothetical protein
MKKKNAQIESLYPQLWGLEIWSRKRFCPHPTSAPHLHFEPPRKNISVQVRPRGQEKKTNFFFKKISRLHGWDQHPRGREKIKIKIKK